MFVIDSRKCLFSQFSDKEADVVGEKEKREKEKKSCNEG